MNSRTLLLAGGFERCLNPVCGKPLEPIAKGTWRRTPRQFCSDGCKNDASVLRRAARLLARVGQDGAWEILRELNGDAGN